MDSGFIQNIYQAVLIGMILIVPVWKIYKKAGLNPALSFILFIPLIGMFIVYVILSFSDWPEVKAKDD